MADMTVKVLRQHTNEFGDRVEKKVEEIYSLPRDHAHLLIKQRFVEEADDDGLEAQTVEQLKGIAASEGVNLGDHSKKADIITAIRTARAV